MANMPKSLSLDNWQICEDFRQAWSEGGRLVLAACLKRCREPAARREVFWNLLEIDLEYRQQRGEEPRLVDYEEFASEFQDVLQHFLSGPTVPPGQEESTPASIPAELRNHPDYALLRELGGGGMGIVYLARNRLMDRLEVLKIVNRNRLHQPGAIDRFLREIRMAARLSHPNIVTAYSALQLADLLVLAMEYVEGENLATVVKSHGPLPVPTACSYVLQAALGLQHAHEHGLVHRDIKPANLILDRQGKKHGVKMLDFGLAKANREGTADTGLTGTGTTLGTPDYMAPEQAQDAARADIRADIYSLGCTLYFLLGGAPPFQGKSPFSILAAHVSRAAKPLNQVRQDVPGELAAVVAKMMAKDPEQRYQEPREVAQALVPFVKTEQQAVPRGMIPDTNSLTAVVVPQVADSTAEAVQALGTPCRRRARRSRLWPLAATGAGILALGLAALLVAFGSRMPRDIGKGDAQKQAQPTEGKAPAPGDVWTNSLRMKFAFVPAGSFWMGGGGGTPGDKQVTIPDGFYLGVYLVTQGEWLLLMDYNPSFASRKGLGARNVKDFSDADLERFPVEQVPWDDVQEFIKRLNNRAPSSGWLYRLPREREWEYACRGGATSKEECSYHFYFKKPTNDLSSDQANINGGFPAGNGKVGVSRRHPTKVGSFEANPLGLFDMHGNVGQWCYDAQGSGRMIRGCGWPSYGIECSAAHRRDPPSPSHRGCGLGFRVARVPVR